MKSKFLTLSTGDILKGLLVAIITALLTGFYELIQAGGDFAWMDLKPVVLATIGAGIAYLLKNLFSNSEGRFAKSERGVMAGYGVKTLILAIVFSGIGMVTSAQPLVPREAPPLRKEKGPWSGFFKPVDKSLFAIRSVMGTIETPRWLFRPAVEISALQLIPSDIEGKIFEVSSFQSLGMGISYDHFIDYNGQPYSNYGFNFLVLFDAIPRETTTLNLSLAGTVSAFQYMNFGGGYNFGMKKFFLLTGITYNFN